MKRQLWLVALFCIFNLAGGVVPPEALAEEISCSPDVALNGTRSIALTGRQVASWSDAPLTTGASLAEELSSYGIPMSELTVGTEVPLTLPGNVENSVYVLERLSPRGPEEHAWIILYSLAPTAVRLEMERQGIRYPWSGFVLTMDAEEAETPLRLGILGQADEQLVFDLATRTFQPASVALLHDQAAAKVSQGCTACIRDLLKSVACEALATGVACATVAGCPGAILSALIRATWKLLTQDLCFPLDLVSCAAACAAPRISLTPASNARLNPGRQQIKVDISGTNAGAWALPVPQNGRPGVPLIKLGSNPRVLDWVAAAGVYTIYAGNIPLANAPGMVRSTNVTVGSTSTASVNWRIVDGCSDNRGFRVRFFDKTNGGVFPSQSEVFTVPAGGDRTFSFNAPRGSRICLGAEQSPPTSSWWCYGINGNQDGSYSAGCCSIVPSTGNLNLGNTLICN